MTDHSGESTFKWSDTLTRPFMHFLLLDFYSVALFGFQGENSSESNCSQGLGGWTEVLQNGSISVGTKHQTFSVKQILNCVLMHFSKYHVI